MNSLETCNPKELFDFLCFYDSEMGQRYIREHRIYPRMNGNDKEFIEQTKQLLKLWRENKNENN